MSTVSKPDSAWWGWDALVIIALIIVIMVMINLIGGAIETVQSTRSRTDDTAARREVMTATLVSQCRAVGGVPVPTAEQGIACVSRDYVLFETTLDQIEAKP